MIRSHFLRTTLAPGLAAAALALAAAAGVAGAAQADPLCLLTQQCSSGSPTPTDPSSGSPAPTAEPSKAPPAKKAPAPTVAPAPPVAPAPAAPTAAAAPTASATARTTATPSPSATAARTTAVAASATPSRSDSGPTAESNWNKPIDKPEKASQAAAVSAGDDGPGGYLGVFAIMGGVLLVGFAGLVFALWSRNRLAGHW